MTPANKRHTPGSPVSPTVAARASELYGMGLSQREAAGAVGISEKTVERILRKPEYRRIADDTRAKREGMAAQAATVVTELLNAVDSKGEPDLLKRKMGAELVVKNPALLAQVEMTEEDAALLPGVILRFPFAATADGGGPGVSLTKTEGEQAPKGAPHSEEKSVNGDTLTPEPDEDLFTEEDYA
jgi:hypothetical protein